MLDRHPNRPSSVLAAFVEVLAEGRRVVVFGDASSRFSEQVLDRGARLVHVCDADPARLAAAVTRNTSQHVSYSPLTTAGLTFREGAFDLGLVEDLSAAEMPPPQDVLRLLRRAVSSRGAVIIVSRNPHVDEALLPSGQAAGRHLDYYDLYDLVSAEFDPLRMFGQMPFVGYSVAEFGRHDDPEPVVDTALVPGGTEEPEWFVAVGGEPSLRLDAFTLVQLPARDMLPAGTRRAHAKIKALQQAERAALRKVAELDAELVLVKEQLRTREPGESRRHDLERALKKRDEWIEQLEARAVTADARADSAEAELESLQSRVGEMEQSSSQAREQIARLQGELISERSRAESLQKELEATPDATEQQRAAEDETLELERQLVERAQRVLELERRLREAQRVGRELIARMESSSRQLPEEEPLRGWEPPDEAVPQPVDTLARGHLELGGDWADAEAARAGTGRPGAAEMGQILRDFAARNAELSADLEAAGWVVAKMHSDLSRAKAVEERLAVADRRLEQAQGGLQSQAVALQSVASAVSADRVR